MAVSVSAIDSESAYVVWSEGSDKSLSISIVDSSLREKWELSFNASPQQTSITGDAAGGVVAFRGDDRDTRLLAFNSNGQKMWETVSLLQEPRVTLTENQIVLEDDVGGICVVHRSDGSLLWRASFDHLHGSAAVSSTRLIVQDGDRVVMANLQDGSRTVMPADGGWCLAGEELFFWKGNQLTALGQNGEERVLLHETPFPAAMKCSRYKSNLIVMSAVSAIVDGKQVENLSVLKLQGNNVVGRVSLTGSGSILGAPHVVWATDSELPRFVPVFTSVAPNELVSLDLEAMTYDPVSQDVPSVIRQTGADWYGTARGQLFVLHGSTNRRLTVPSPDVSAQQVRSGTVWMVVGSEVKRQDIGRLQGS